MQSLDKHQSALGNEPHAGAIKRPVEFASSGFCALFGGADGARRSQDLGFDIQIFSENHTRSPDVFGEMRDAARATETIKLFAGPVNFVTRDPGVIAAAIAPVQILSNGRAICGIARGDSAVAMAGKAPCRQTDLESGLASLRSYLALDSVDFGARQSRLEWVGSSPYQPVPIAMVCSGPRAIALAATKVDLISLSVGYNPSRVRWALDIIDASLAAAERDRSTVRVGLFGPIAITKDRADALAVLRPRIAPWAHMSSFRGNDLSQQPAVMSKVTEALRDGYDYRFHRRDAAPDSPNAQMVDEEFADWFGIGGPPSYVQDRLGELVEMGVDYFSVGLDAEENERFASDVMPAVRELRR